MTTFPSKSYRLLCIENAERLREEWEPKPGDWCIVRDPGKDYIYIVSVPPYSGGPIPGRDELVLQCIDSNLNFGVYANAAQIIGQEAIIPLPSQRQLEAMLEERGYRWNVGVKTTHTKVDKYRAAAFTDEEMTAYLLGHGRHPIQADESWSPTKAKIIWTGPDPETALLRALLEVMEEESGGD